MKRTTVLIFLFILAITNFSCDSKSGKRIKNVKFFPVTKVIDGDTFWVDDGSEKGFKIRMIGVDAPESRNVFNKVIGYYGQESKNFMTTLLTGKNVRLECDIDSLDQYGRTLAYVYLQDGTFVNAELVKQGYAMIMTVPPNVKYADLFLKLQKKARAKNRGLWKENKSLYP